MAYTPQTWVDSPSGVDNTVNAARLNYIEQGIEEAHILAAGGGGGGGGGTQQYLTVASSQLPAPIRDACDYVCTGVNDQIQINTALRRASRPNDGFTGAEGRIGVALVGPRFFVGNSTAGLGAGAITMYPSTHLVGAGPGTIITPQWSSNVDRGCIELVNVNTAHTRISNFTIGNHNAVVVNGHGVKYTNNGTADAYEFMTGSDTFHQISYVTTLKTAGHGFWLTGTTGGNREAQIHNCLAWASEGKGFWLDGSSDCQISDCRATGGGDNPRFHLAGGNVKAANCKSYFSGNTAGNLGATAGDGFLVTSSRIAIANCDAQDNGRWGFNISGANVTATGLVADSNSRGTTSGGGFTLSGQGVYEGIHAHNRTQNAITQNRGIVFTGSPKLYLTGRVSMDQLIDGPGTAVQGTVTGYVRVVRDGTGADATSLYSVG